ncbi:hypothetical protein [Roseimaritima ulvae]|uniref:Uncharacterized protein n=1 Tax=Roseimaritima ulvae TaxID=980254 RepID=A0A5B9QVK0_9BACT|nr:hypothetical protein [Roseimaritima ulvae]QEG41405.1 hypothetical protein UC8_34260 [Roseimaritima ulvae]
MSKLLQSLAACLLAISLVGCIEESVVVKVNRDGTGVVHVRSFQQETKIGLSFGSAEEKTISDEDDDEDLPSEDKLRALATRLGKGVRFESLAASKNPQGWKGFEVVFAFDDVNTLRLTDDLFSLSRDDDDDAENAADDDRSTSEKSKPEMKLAEGTRFRLQGDRLLITNDWDLQQSADADAAPPSPTKDPFAEEPKSVGTASLAGPQMEKIMAAMLKDARVGLFVELEGGIGETNARFHKNDQITLYKIEIGPMLEQKQAVEKLTHLSKRHRGAELRSETQKLANEIKGMDVDFQDQISIQFTD